VLPEPNGESTVGAMTAKMTRWGVGPVFAIASIAYAAAVHLLWRGKSALQIEIVPHSALVWAGIALIAVGLPLYVLSAKAVMRAYNADRLVTDGMYRICRHPLYGAWIVFIVPGIELLMGTWAGLTTPVAMYVLLRVMASKEEDYLSARFGDGYQQYRRRVPFVAPLGWLRPARSEETPEATNRP
jgi:protein-S-isoprenylcysteine O-methyltransferase Ste14